MGSIKQGIKKIIGEKNIRFIKRNYSSLKHEKLKKRRVKFYSKIFENGDIFFDIGANNGNRIEPVIDKGLSIIAVEPQHECVKFLKEKYGDKITVVNKGVGAIREKKTLYISNASTLSTFSKKWIEATKLSKRFTNYNWNSKREILMTTLDELIIEFGRPKYIKIDVEGFEVEVIKGLSTPIDLISFEYAIPESYNNAIECIKRVLKFTPTVLCNYAPSETLKMASSKWLEPEEMFNEMKTPKFINSGFGDIYLKSVED